MCCAREIIVGKFNKCQSDISRFLAENGSRSVYDLVKTLRYKYQYIHRNTNKLKEMEFVEFRKDSTGDRIRKLVNLDFRGMTIFLIAWKDYAEEIEEKAIK